ncbi:MAG: helix-turn-helix transcriptional regulator [Longimicrobiales bacterium]
MNKDHDFSSWASACGPGFRFGGRRRRRRVFARGDLKYMILGLLEEKPMHGYEVMQRLEQESGGFWTASPGSVYPVLQMLEDQGHVASEQIDGKRVYRITDEGRAFLGRNRERVDDVADRVSDFGSMFGGRGMGELTTSFMKLAQVSFERAMDAAGDPAAVRSLREILDRAAKDVESWKRR